MIGPNLSLNVSNSIVLSLAIISTSSESGSSALLDILRIGTFENGFDDIDAIDAIVESVSEPGHFMRRYFLSRMCATLPC